MKALRDIHAGQHSKPNILRDVGDPIDGLLSRVVGPTVLGYHATIRDIRIGVGIFFGQWVEKVKK